VDALTGITRKPRGVTRVGLRGANSGVVGPALTSRRAPLFFSYVRLTCPCSSDEELLEKQRSGVCAVRGRFCVTRNSLGVKYPIEVCGLTV
jgi:hypothetical protein